MLASHLVKAGYPDFFVVLSSIAGTFVVLLA
jgi:hypothetical protein